MRNLKTKIFCYIVLAIFIIVAIISMFFTDGDKHTASTTQKSEETKVIKKKIVIIDDGTLNFTEFKDLEFLNYTIEYTNDTIDFKEIASMLTILRSINFVEYYVINNALVYNYINGTTFEGEGGLEKSLEMISDKENLIIVIPPYNEEDEKELAKIYFNDKYNYKEYIEKFKEICEQLNIQTIDLYEESEYAQKNVFETYNDKIIKIFEEKLKRKVLEKRKVAE